MRLPSWYAKDQKYLKGEMSLYIWETGFLKGNNPAVARKALRRTAHSQCENKIIDRKPCTTDE
jgi:hypothetical protein